MAGIRWFAAMLLLLLLEWHLQAQSYYKYTPFVVSSLYCTKELVKCQRVLCTQMFNVTRILK